MCRICREVTYPSIITQLPRGPLFLERKDLQFSPYEDLPNRSTSSTLGLPNLHPVRTSQRGIRGAAEEVPRNLHRQTSRTPHRAPPRPAEHLLQAIEYHKDGHEPVAYSSGSGRCVATGVHCGLLRRSPVATQRQLLPPMRRPALHAGGARGRLLHLREGCGHSR